MPRYTRKDEADCGPQTCRHCGHRIGHYPDVGWVDLTSPAKAGLYDFCTSTAGTHEPQGHDDRP